MCWRRLSYIHPTLPWLTFFLHTLLYIWKEVEKTPQKLGAFECEKTKRSLFDLATKSFLSGWYWVPTRVENRVILKRAHLGRPHLMPMMMMMMIFMMIMIMIMIMTMITIIISIIKQGIQNSKVMGKEKFSGLNIKVIFWFCSSHFHHCKIVAGIVPGDKNTVSLLLRLRNQIISFGNWPFEEKRKFLLVNNGFLRVWYHKIRGAYITNPQIQEMFISITTK